MSDKRDKKKHMATPAVAPKASAAPMAAGCCDDKKPAHEKYTPAAQMKTPTHK